MNKCGISKEVYKLGRIVISKEMRELFKITKTVEIVVTEEGDIIKKR